MSVLAVLAFALQAIPAAGSFAYVADNGVYLWQGTAKPRLLAKNATFPSLSPDGRRLAFDRENAVWVKDLRSGKEERVTEQVLAVNEHMPRIHFTRGFQPAWTKDGKALLFAVPDLVRVARAHPVAGSAWGGYPSQVEIWSIYRIRLGLPQHPRDLLFGPNDGGVSTFEIASTCCPAASPDGKKIAYCRGGDLWLANLDEGNWSGAYPTWDESRIWTNRPQEGGIHGDNYTSFIFRISWSPSGSKLAVSTQRIGGGGNNDVTIVTPKEPAKEIATLEGRSAVFFDEDRLIYAVPNGDGLLLRSLKQGRSRTLISDGDWPVLFR